MKKALLFLTMAILIGACEPQENGYYGYVEGEYVFVAPTRDGLLKHLYVRRGQQVCEGDALFTLDMTALDSERAAINAQIEQALVAEKTARKELTRLRALRKKKAVSQAQEDAQEATYATAKSARKEAEQALVQINKTRIDAAPLAPASGFIDDTYFKEGEYVGAGKPVVSLLPPENIKVRFFVPQADVATFPLGKKIRVHCDGCGAPVDATISFIASQSEYTPPIIYSIESRAKLVFMIEATPDTPSLPLRPGLPVDIEVP